MVGFLGNILSCFRPKVDEKACVFCNIANTPGKNILYEDDTFLAFEDVRPAAKHHFLVVPKAHVESVRTLDQGHVPFLKDMEKVGIAVMDKYNVPEDERRLVLSPIPEQVERVGADVSRSMGFHIPPFNSVNHLHLHVHALPYRSSLVKKKYPIVNGSGLYHKGLVCHCSGLQLPHDRLKKPSSGYSNHEFQNDRSTVRGNVHAQNQLGEAGFRPHPPPHHYHAEQGTSGFYIYLSKTADVMHRCLEVVEIVRSICANLDVPSAYRLALTSRSLLEPSLDEIWWTVVPFAPLAACLPEDLWIEDTVQLDASEEPITMLHLRRSIEQEDMARYLSYYAPRIRKVYFDFDHRGCTMLSQESLNALQVATEYHPGALSPSLKIFRWFDVAEAESYLGEGLGRQFSPYMNLFLSNSVDSLSVSLYNDDPPLHKASVQLAVKRLHPSLKEVEVGGESLRESHWWTQLPWAQLDQFHGRRVSMEDVFSFRPLSQVSILKVTYLSTETTNPNPSSNPVHYPSLASLRKLEGRSARIEDVMHYMNRLATPNCLQTISYFGLSSSTVSQYQDVINCISRSCNALTLSAITLQNNRLARLPPEPLDVEYGQVEIPSLFPFKRLESVRLELFQAISVCPETAERIPYMWPKLTCLILSPAFSTSRPPSIDHTHIIQLLDGLPALRELGVRFNATVIEPEETSPGSHSQYRLRILRVGNSPILSPSRVQQFLSSKLPYLEALDVTYMARADEDTLYRRRWEAVRAGWSTARAEQ
ncbi:hypothetical protein NMY22_g1443 [Coprinellus aureogranulatus]|nr:hypothetical protein NMY22_g1443 [Coprinellus aureogranulatus]